MNRVLPVALRSHDPKRGVDEISLAARTGSIVVCDEGVVEVESDAAMLQVAGAAPR